MFVDYLQLADFRSYEAVDVALGAGVRIFVGANGQGKTNLVEAIEYLSTLSSHRVSSDQPLVRVGAERAIVRARVQAGLGDPRQLQLELEITPGKANRARLNRSPLRRARELVGVLRTVVFAPDDLAIVKGDPSERRRFLDDLVVSRWPRLAGVRADYDRALRQRNTLLKSLGGRVRGASASRDGVDSARLGHPPGRRGRRSAAGPTHHAGRSRTARAQGVRRDRPDQQRRVRRIQGIDRRQRAHLGSFRGPAGLAEAMLRAMADLRSEEIARGLSLVGPHRDDITLTLGMLPARGYASHGESWSFALALKLGSFSLLRADGIEPVLVLDDVFAELDLTRRERLAAGVSVAEQVLVTAAVSADVPEVLRGRRYSVSAGQVTPDD